MFQDFVNSPCMLEIKERSCFIHVDVPGHADNDQPLSDRFVWVLDTHCSSYPSIVLIDFSDFCSLQSLIIRCNWIFISINSFQFPSLKTLGEDLVTVLDFLHVKYIIGLGEGAGANVLARFGLAHASRCLGLILINCTGSAASVVQSFKNKVRIRIHIFHRIEWTDGNNDYITHFSSLLGKAMKLHNQLKIFFYTTSSVM